MKNILVTGAGGFVGSNLVKELVSQGVKVVALDWFNPQKEFCKGKPQNLDGFNSEIINQDIRSVDWGALLDKHQFDTVFHQAAIAVTTIHDADEMFSVNVSASQRLFNAAIPRNIRVVYASSAAVYGHEASPNRELGAHKPTNVYGDSKLILDYVAERLMQKHPDARLVGLRYFNVFGPGEEFKGSMASMVHQLFHEMIKGQKPGLFPDGSQKRDFIFVKDVVQANLLAAKAGKSGIYNVGTGKPNSYNRMVELLNKFMGKNLETDYERKGMAPGFFQELTQADTALAKRELGFEAQISFEEGVKRYVEYLLSDAHRKKCNDCNSSKIP